MKNKNVLLFLARGFEEFEASVFTDVIGCCIYITGDADFQRKCRYR